MPRYGVAVEVMPKPGISDPQGTTIEKALPALGFQEVNDMRVGKLLHFEITADSVNQARAQVEAMCDQLLANPVIEDFKFQVRRLKPDGASDRAG